MRIFDEQLTLLHKEMTIKVVYDGALENNTEYKHDIALSKIRTHCELHIAIQQSQTIYPCSYTN